jgi:hypothetical protein
MLQMIDFHQYHKSDPIIPDLILLCYVSFIFITEAVGLVEVTRVTYYSTIYLLQLQNFYHNYSQVI